MLNRHAMQQRWFVLADHHLSYLKLEKDGQMVPARGRRAQRYHVDSLKEEDCIVDGKQLKIAFGHGPVTTDEFVLEAPTVEAARLWQQKLKDAKEFYASVKHSRPAETSAQAAQPQPAPSPTRAVPPPSPIPAAPPLPPRGTTAKELMPAPEPEPEPEPEPSANAEEEARLDSTGVVAVLLREVRGLGPLASEHVHCVAQASGEVRRSRVAPIRQGRVEVDQMLSFAGSLRGLIAYGLELAIINSPSLKLSLAVQKVRAAAHARVPLACPPHAPPPMPSPPPAHIALPTPSRHTP